MKPETLANEFDATPSPVFSLPALQQSESVYKHLLNSLPTGVYTCDKEGRISFYNETAAQLWGCKPRLNDSAYHFFGWHRVMTLDGTIIPPDKTPMAIAITTGESFRNVEAITESVNGDRHYISVNIDPLLDEAGNVTGAINIFQDITALKQTENALRESEERYRHLAATLEKTIEEKTHDLKLKTKELMRSEERYHKMVEEVEDYAIILLDKDGIVQNWNKGAEKIKGYKEAEIVGKSFSTFYLPKDRERGLPKRLLELARESGKALHEGWRMRKDGSAFWGSIVLTALHDDQNNVIGFSKVTRDLTERKFAEDRLKEYTRQLEFQNKELEQFAYAASHDMKEPLRKIIFYNSYLWENLTEKLSEREKDYLNRSVTAAHRMRSLIDDLLEYSRATVETQEPEPVDLNEIVDEIILSYKEVVEQTGATISFSSLPVVNGISFQLRQLFDNLLSNALKYHHPERNPVIQVQAEKTTGEGIKGLDKQAAYYKIRMSDNGIGFLPESAEKVFELFHRLSTDKSSGTGVGLALCKRIVQNHHGAITAAATPNEGATFSIYLPA